MANAPAQTAAAAPLIRFWAATDVGLTRDHNEDNFLVDKKLKLFVVADGMGGHAAGEVASSVAVHEVRRVISEHRQIISDFNESGAAQTRIAVLELLDTAIRAACRKVFQQAEENPERKGMGTTLSFMIIAGDRGFIGHVGDSRIYLVRDGKVQQLTEDHSLINELIKRGRLQPGDEFDSPYKNAVTRAVGVYETVDGDTFDFEVRPGDNYLLCSDGLSCYLDDPITVRFATLENVKASPAAFIDLANESGGKDNITAIVVRALEPVSEPPAEVAASISDKVTNKLPGPPSDDPRDDLDTLQAIPLFKYVGKRSLDRIMEITDARRFGAGEHVFQAESDDDAFYVLVDGQVELSRDGVVLATVGPGGHFGEMAMVDKAPRSANAKALTPIRVLVLERSRFFELMRTDPVLAVKLTWSLIQTLNTRLRMTNRELLTARETIEVLRRNQVGGVVAEVPALDPALSDVTAMPIMVTDEFVPEFLFEEAARGGTDPLIRIAPEPLGERKTVPVIKAIEADE
jgi:serine/threonine protein phosphatase PrpC